MSTIEELKSTTSSQTLSSPRKSNKTINCAVLTKSPLKDTKRGKMFTMTLCDRDTTSTIRSVCFDENVFDKFVATKTYDLKSFKLKKGMGNNKLEILISQETEVAESLAQFAIEKRCFKISQIIRRETLNVNFFNVKAKVISIEDVETVGKYPNEKQKRDVILGDESGQVTLVLWRQRANSVDFKEGDVLNIENAVTSTFNRNVMVTTSAETTITTINEVINVEVPTASTSLRKRSIVTSVETSVLALKEFRCQYRCINCRKDIEWLDASKSSTGDVVIKCPTCSTIFMAHLTKVKNECQLMLSYNDQWFTASTAVLQHIFEWNSPKREPSQQDIESLLKSKFSMRFNLDRKIIEHAIILQCEDMFHDNQEGPLAEELQPTSPKKFKDNKLCQDIEDIEDILAEENEDVLAEENMFIESTDEKSKVD